MYEIYGDGEFLNAHCVRYTILWIVLISDSVIGLTFYVWPKYSSIMNTQFMHSMNANVSRLIESHCHEKGNHPHTKKKTFVLNIWLYTILYLVRGGYEGLFNCFERIFLLLVNGADERSNDVNKLKMKNRLLLVIASRTHTLQRFRHQPHIQHHSPIAVRNSSYMAYSVLWER